MIKCHEQNNETVQGSGGAVGLTENHLVFCRWWTRAGQVGETEFIKVSDNQLQSLLLSAKSLKEQTKCLVSAMCIKE